MYFCGDESYWVSFQSGDARWSRTSHLSLRKKHKSSAFSNIPQTIWHDLRPNICPSKEQLSLSLCCGLPLVQTLQALQRDQVFQGDRHHPEDRTQAQTHTANQAELTTVWMAGWILFRRDHIPYLRQLQQDHVHRSLRGDHQDPKKHHTHTLGMGHNTTQYWCTDFLKLCWMLYSVAWVSFAAGSADPSNFTLVGRRWRSVSKSDRHDLTFSE